MYLKNKKKIILTIHGDCLQKQTWDLFVLCRYRWLNIQTNHNMDWRAPWTPGKKTLLMVHCSPTFTEKPDITMKQETFFFLIYIPYIIFWLKFRKILTKTLIRADCLMPKYVELSRDYAKMEWLGGLEWSSPCGLLSEKSFGSSCNGLFATGIWPIGGGEMGRRKIMKRAKIRLICIWQINNENKQWSYFVFADLQP